MKPRIINFPKVAHLLCPPALPTCFAHPHTCPPSCPPKGIPLPFPRGCVWLGVLVCKMPGGRGPALVGLIAIRLRAISGSSPRGYYRLSAPLSSDFYSGPRGREGGWGSPAVTSPELYSRGWGRNLPPHPPQKLRVSFLQQLLRRHACQLVLSRQYALFEGTCRPSLGERCAILSACGGSCHHAVRSGFQDGNQDDA